MTGPSHVKVPAEWLRGEVAVLGLARSGSSAAQLLARLGVKVYASDAGSGAALEATAATLTAHGVEVELGGHNLARIARASLVVTSPGIPPDAEPLVVAREAGVPIVSEVEVGLRALPHLRYIAITGTNGKTTTTGLTAHLLNALGLRAVAAGNIGLPLCEVALANDPVDWVALEISSFQLHDTPSIAPDAGVLTNLSGNHLDRYKDIAEYYGDKALLFRNANSQSTWILNADDEAVLELAASAAGQHKHFSIAKHADAWYDRAAHELIVMDQPVLPRAELSLVGDHNVANALAATLAVMSVDARHRTPDAIAKLGQALRGFRALPHRIQPVGTYGGVEWINDSKATSVAATLVALKGMTRPTVLMLGGRHKGEPYTPLASDLRRTGRCVIAYGEAGPIVQADLRGVLPVQLLPAGTPFKAVMAAARSAAKPGDVVLLSPACSSYDMFDNYEERGREFARLAAMKGESA